MFEFILVDIKNMSDFKSCKNTFFSVKHTINCSGKIVDLSVPKVMGILNVSPDSFYDGGSFSTERQWLAHTEKMLHEGAAIIDIGAVTSKPGSKAISEDEEFKRIMPPLVSIRRHFPECIISIDTYRSAIAEAVIPSGADIINDISAGSIDKKMFPAIARLNVPYIIMHMIGTPENMQANPVYEDVVNDICMYFSDKVYRLRSLGVKDIIIDPGFGFGKTLIHNYEILRKLEVLKILDMPLLVGFSRKSMIYNLLGSNPENALNGTSVLNTVALLKGAKILRVHDVKQAVEAVRLIENIIS